MDIILSRARARHTAALVAATISRGLLVTDVEHVVVLFFTVIVNVCSDTQKAVA